MRCELAIAEKNKIIIVRSQLPVFFYYWVAEMGFHKFCKLKKKKNSAFKWFKVCTEATALHHVRRLDDGFPPSLHACFSFIRQSCGRPSIQEEWRPNVQSIDCLHPWTSLLEIALTQAPSHNEEQTLRSFICRTTGPAIFLQNQCKGFSPPGSGKLNYGKFSIPSMSDRA